jgi:2-polyprenyl-3-methyl-5-hydroxy-6-metoxy-1,4-benzoquinol methylase
MTSAGLPGVSAIVLGGAHADERAACIRTLRAGSATPQEIVVVADEGDAATASQAADQAGSQVPVRAVRAPAGSTWAASVNIGLAHAAGPMLAIVDASCQVGPGWLEVLLRFIESHPDAAAVEGRLTRHARGADPGTAARTDGYVQVDPGALLWTLTDAGLERTREVASLSPHAFLIRRAALDSLGPGPLDVRFRTDLAAHDLFARLLERRWRLYHLPEAEARARQRDAACPAPELDGASRRESLLFAWKHLSRPERDHHIALATRQANLGLRGLLAPPSPATPAAREALAWMRGHERELEAERAAGGLPDDAFTQAVDAAQSRAKYSFYVRQDILDVIPADAKVVIDVGCAAGVLGGALKQQRPGIQVRGVEIFPEAAARAREVLDDVHCGSAETPLPDAWPRPDCVVFADVLEHLPDPWAVLRRYRAMLGPGGRVVVSVPNVAHRSVVEGLLRGRFDYVDAGILDRTHLRFFTRASAIDLLESTGFKVEQVRRNLDRVTQPRWLRVAIRLGVLSAFLEDIQAVQFLIVARVAGDP